MATPTRPEKNGTDLVVDEPCVNGPIRGGEGVIVVSSYSLVQANAPDFDARLESMAPMRQRQVVDPPQLVPTSLSVLLLKSSVNCPESRVTS